MNFTIGYFINPQQLSLVTDHGTGELENKIIDWELYEQNTCDGLLYPKNLLEVENITNLLQEELRFVPVRCCEDFTLNPTVFTKLSPAQFQALRENLVETWVLQNNVSLLGEFFPTISHLRGLLPNDRSNFFAELWYLLKLNLGAQYLKIIYNDLFIEPEKETSKNKLIQVTIAGQRAPSPQDGKAVEAKLMDHYRSRFSTYLEITDQNPAKGEFVLTATINKGPILIMANTHQINALQKNLLSSLIQGLQIELT